MRESFEQRCEHAHMLDDQPKIRRDLLWEANPSQPGLAPSQTALTAPLFNGVGRHLPVNSVREHGATGQNLQSRAPEESNDLLTGPLRIPGERETPSQPGLDQSDDMGELI
jgi:hypothetical protein